MGDYRVQVVIDLLDCRIDPHEISRALAVTPEVARLKGDRLGKSGNFARRTAWMLYSKASSYEADESEHIDYLKRILHGKEKLLAELAHKCSAKITVIVNNEDNSLSSLFLDNWLVKLAAMMGGHIDIDVYRSFGPDEGLVELPVIAPPSTPAG